MKEQKYLILLVIMSTAMSSCSYRSLVGFLKPPQSYTKTPIPKPPDYSQVTSWHIINPTDTQKLTDVFFVHPTTYIKGKGWNQVLDDAKINERTRILSLRYQASIFYENHRVFVPKYRQATFYAFADKKDNGKQALDLAYQDVKTAFEYYLEHHNQGRPVILAAHSQGSFHLKRLLAEMQENKQLKEKLIVAYLAGWVVPNTYFEQENTTFAACSTATQTTCVASWNTEGEAPKMSLVEIMGEGQEIYCINPLSWKTTTENIPKEQNKGALQPDPETGKSEIILNYCNAQIKNGVVKIKTPSNVKDLQTPMGKGNYHLYDYSFFYENIKENAQKRSEIFIKSKEN